MPKKNDGSIALHPEHGLNPTMPVCYYCGEHKNEVALLGAGYDGEAPRQMILDVAPCDACKERYKDFVLMLAAVDLAEGDKLTDSKRAIRYRNKLKSTEHRIQDYYFLVVGDYMVYIAQKNFNKDSLRPFVALKKGPFQKRFMPDRELKDVPSLVFTALEAIELMQGDAVKAGVQAMEG